MSTALSYILAAVLAWSALAKLVRPRTGVAALSTFGIVSKGLAWLTWSVSVALELALSLGIALGFTPAAYGAAGLMAGYAAVMAQAVRSGQSGKPCGCFGARSKVSWTAVGRNLLLALCFAALPSVPVDGPTAEQWLVAGVCLALVAVLGLTVAVVALAREVGMLRLALGPQVALELSGEGPVLNSQVAIDPSRFTDLDGKKLGLAIFTSEGCGICRKLQPAIALLDNDEELALAEFDELRDNEIWRELSVPGSPYAIALSSDLQVLAKGTFNNLAQLESLVATAEQRRNRQTEVVSATV